MPKYAHYQLQWSTHAQAYILWIGEQASEHTLTRDWLEQIASFSFRSCLGMHYTVRKQRVQRGNSYWYAYRRLHGRIVKRYIGKTADLTFARLEEIARLLERTPSTRQGFVQADQATSLPQSAPHSVYAQAASSPAVVGALPLIESKLSPPRLQTALLERPRLFALLDAGRACHLTLLSAPAGFGKTTLVCQWIAAQRARCDFPPVAWVSLEASDNDPVRFWRYLITACQTFPCDLAQSHAALRDITPQPPFLARSLEHVLTLVLNALAQCSSSGILVLEDYHVVTAPQIHETIAFFLDHLPANIQLIMITRSDPPFSLARRRVSFDVYEVRAADLCFSQAELATLLQQALAFPLAAEIIAQLHAHLEGWAAGLHLVKLALQKATTPAEAEQTLARFPHSTSFFQAYFVTEVLDRQPHAVQQFLLQTSILNRLTSSLCDAIAEQHNSQDMLTLLERANLFLEPLDTAGQWYRYHALFAEAMRNEARHRIGGEHMQCLSARASHWYEVRGLLSEAIDAALYAQEYVRAAGLIERAIVQQTVPGELHEPHTLRRWLEHMPKTILNQYPLLCLSYATTRLFLNDSWRLNQVSLDALEQLVHSAEQGFLAQHNLPKLGEIHAFRALLAWRQDDSHAAARYAQQALEWLPHTQPIWRTFSLCMVGKEWLETKQFQLARAALLEAQTLGAAENHFTRVATILLAQVYFEQGKLQHAATAYRQVLASATADTHAHVRCYALAGVAELAYEWNELERAYQHAQEIIAESQPLGLEVHVVRATLIQARVHQAHGNISGAQQHLAALLDRLPASWPDLAHEIQTAQAQLALAAGDYVAVQRWETGRTPHSDVAQGLEHELLLSRWLRIQGKHEAASCQLERLLAAAQKVGHTRRVLEIQVEIVLLANARKQKAEAQHVLQNVLAQAFESNLMRLFLDAGAQMAALLRALLSQLRGRPLHAYVLALLNAFAAQQHVATQVPEPFLVEPLSPQEMRVLRLLVQQRSNADIAHALVVSVNTVRTQVQSIYRKLGVHTRSAASEVARDLHLL